MKVQSPAPNWSRPRTLSGAGAAPTEETPPQDKAEVRPASFKAYAAGSGGLVLGTGAGLASAAATQFLGQQLGRVLEASAPTLDGVAPGAGTLLAHAARFATLGSTVAAGVGGMVGAQIAFGAGNGATKPGLTETNPQGGPLRTNAAELRENLAAVGSAKSFKGAMGAGFRAGATLGGPAGAQAGRIQGALLGAALGGVAGVPLMSLVSHPAVLIPGAIAGALMGAKIGEPIGHAAGSFALGAVGAAGASVVHAGRSALGKVDAPA